MSEIFNIMNVFSWYCIIVLEKAFFILIGILYTLFVIYQNEWILYWEYNKNYKTRWSKCNIWNKYEQVELQYGKIPPISHKTPKTSIFGIINVFWLPYFKPLIVIRNVENGPFS